MRVLHVREAGVADSGFERRATVHLEYAFVAHDSGDGFAAWEVSRSDARVEVSVHESTRSSNGGYSQFALNRIVAAQLVRQQAQLLVVEGLYGCTIDLPRIAKILGVPCVWLMPAQDEPLVAPDAFLGSLVENAIRACESVFTSATNRAWLESELSKPVAELLQDITVWPEYRERIAGVTANSATERLSLHPMLNRDPTLLTRMQQADVAHFAKMQSVLDVGCGVGIFLDQLRRSDIGAIGVERDPDVAAYGRGSGLNIEVSDALAFLRQSALQFDGMYCSHFIEHLPVDAAQELISLMSARLQPGGVLLLVFPDPESIRTQLLGFWRDPEHERLYHPELVTTMAESAGLELEWSSYMSQPHAVTSFPEHPPEIELPELVGKALPDAPVPATLADKCLALFGFSSLARTRRLEAQMRALAVSLDVQAEQTAAILRALEERTRTLWSVNQTWAWNDNVTLKLRKPVGEV